MSYLNIPDIHDVIHHEVTPHAKFPNRHSKTVLPVEARSLACITSIELYLHLFTLKLLQWESKWEKMGVQIKTREDLNKTTSVQNKTIEVQMNSKILHFKVK